MGDSDDRLSIHVIGRAFGPSRDNQQRASTKNRLGLSSCSAASTLSHREAKVPEPKEPISDLVWTGQSTALGEGVTSDGEAPRGFKNPIGWTRPIVRDPLN